MIVQILDFFLMYTVSLNLFSSVPSNQQTTCHFLLERVKKQENRIHNGILLQEEPQNWELNSLCLRWKISPWFFFGSENLKRWQMIASLVLKRISTYWEKLKIPPPIHTYKLSWLKKNKPYSRCSRTGGLGAGVWGGQSLGRGGTSAEMWFIESALWSFLFLQGNLSL